MIRNFRNTNNFSDFNIGIVLFICPGMRKRQALTHGNALLENNAL